MNIINKIYPSNKYGDVKIIRLISRAKFKSNDIYEIEFINSGYRKRAAISNIRKGEVEDDSSTKVKYFNAHNDLKRESVRLGERNIYDNWLNLLRRCSMDENYKNVKISDSWKIFSNFKNFVLNPENGYRDNYKIEKDMLSQYDNPIYSDETCVYVPNFINTIIIDKKRDKIEKYPSGVKSYNRNQNKVIVRISILGKHITIGYCDKSDILKAFCMYKVAKEALFHLTAKKYKHENLICDKAYHALLNFKFYDLRKNRFSKEEIDSKMVEFRRSELDCIYQLIKHNFKTILNG